MVELPHVNAQLHNVLRTDRVEEHGQIKNYARQSFCLVFETEPIWLLALQPQFTKYIYLSGYTSLSNFHCDLQQHKIDLGLYHNAITSLGFSSFIFSPPPNNITYLLSGSISFLNEQSHQIVTKEAIYITDKHTRFRRALPSTNLSWKRLSHVEVGGATNFEHIYSYGSSTLVFTGPHILHTCLLPIHHLTRYIYFTTHFSHNCFGYRALNATELSAIFDLPSTVSNFGESYILPPVSWMHSILHPILLTSMEQPQDLPTFSLPPIHDDPGYHVFPAFNKRLPHLWYQHQVATHSAVKSDSAAVDYSLWDLRITLLFPHIPSSTLPTFRRSLLSHLFSKLFQQFKVYLSITKSPRF